MPQARVKRAVGGVSSRETDDASFALLVSKLVSDALCFSHRLVFGLSRSRGLSVRVVTVDCLTVSNKTVNTLLKIIADDCNRATVALSVAPEPKESFMQKRSNAWGFRAKPLKNS